MLYISSVNFSFGVLEILGRGYKFLVLHSASLPLQAELMFIESFQYRNCLHDGEWELFLVLAF